MEINLKSWILLSLVLLVGLELCYQGWRMYKYNQKILLPTEKAALWLLRILKSEEAALKRGNELTSLKRIHQMGIYAMIIGALALISGIIGIIGLILMIV